MRQPFAPLVWGGGHPPCPASAAPGPQTAGAGRVRGPPVGACTARRPGALPRQRRPSSERSRLVAGTLGRFRLAPSALADWPPWPCGYAGAATWADPWAWPAWGSERRARFEATRKGHPGCESPVLIRKAVCAAHSRLRAHARADDGMQAWAILPVSAAGLSDAPRQLPPSPHGGRCAS